MKRSMCLVLVPCTGTLCVVLSYMYCGLIGISWFAKQSKSRRDCPQSHCSCDLSTFQCCHGKFSSSLKYRLAPLRIYFPFSISSVHDFVISKRSHGVWEKNRGQFQAVRRSFANEKEFESYPRPLSSTYIVQFPLRLTILCSVLC